MERERVCLRESVCVCVCVRERERESQRERESVGAFIPVNHRGGREREREFVCDLKL